MTARRFTGEYADDGKAQRLRVRTEAGHRCIRCQHPFESGKHGKGEWSPCDERCTHTGPISEFIDNVGWVDVDENCRIPAGVLVKNGDEISAKWRILTVHHLDGNKSNDHWSNTLSLCQRCHLVIQGKVDPRIPYFLEHSEWFRPFAAAYYAKKYLDQTLSREEVMARLDELLAYESKA